MSCSGEIIGNAVIIEIGWSRWSGCSNNRNGVDGAGAVIVIVLDIVKVILKSFNFSISSCIFCTYFL